MIQVYPDVDLDVILKRFANSALAGLTWRLYTNNVTPSNASVLGDFTEAGFGGYFSSNQDQTTMTLSGVIGHVGTITGLPIAFNNGSGVTQNVYGYYVTDAANSQLFAAARFDAAPVAIPDGGNVLVLPTLSIQWNP